MRITSVQNKLAGRKPGREVTNVQLSLGVARRLTLCEGFFKRCLAEMRRKKFTVAYGNVTAPRYEGKTWMRLNKHLFEIGRWANFGDRRVPKPYWLELYLAPDSSIPSQAHLVISSAPLFGSKLRKTNADFEGVPKTVSRRTRILCENLEGHFAQYFQQLDRPEVFNPMQSSGYLGMTVALDFTKPQSAQDYFFYVLGSIENFARDKRGHKKC